MNKRINLLAEQATTVEVISGRGFDTTQYIDRFDKEKFAELIVKECAKIAAKNQAEDMGWNISEIIKEHFGVK